MEETDNDAYNKNMVLVGSYISIMIVSIVLKSQRIARLHKCRNGVKESWKPHFIIENINPDAGTPEARSNEAIETKLNTTVISLIRAKDESSFDKTLAEYKDFLKSNKWEAIEKIKSEKMAENKKKS